MLDKLIISRNSAGESTKFRRLLASTFVFVTSLFTIGLIYSLFSQNLAMGNDSLNISALIAPPSIPLNEPPKPRTEEPAANKDQQKSPNVTTRKENILRIDEHPGNPTSVSTSRPTSEARPNVPFTIGSSDQTKISETLNSNISVGQRCSNCSTTGNSIGGTKDGTSDAVKPKTEDPVGKPPAIKKPAVPPIASLGVVNSVAKNLITPSYPVPARTAGIEGKVNVEVLIDERGRVISANVIDGHKFLRTAAVRAALTSTFSPTLLSNVPVKARGVIIYNFKR
ncbi:MAG: energy transducer TonB [Pyrinomonadaceae bacterium]